MTTVRKAAWAALVVALASFLSACGAKNPNAPSDPSVTNSPASTGPTASLAGLSTEAQNYILTGTMSKDIVQRWADRSDPIRVFPGTFAESDVAKATTFWEARTSLRFQFVSTESEAEIVIANELPGSGTSAEACGSAAVSGALPITAGRARVAFGIKEGCDGGLVTLITHELGHILGYGHRSEGLDVMSPHAILQGSPALDEAAPWIYTAPLGAKVVQ